MSANFITFVNELIYGDMGSAELGASAHLPSNGLNHLRWTLQEKPSSPTSTVSGEDFLNHHLDYMLASYEEWAGKYFLPPLQPWNGQDLTPGSGSVVGATMPTNLNGSPFPAGWTLNDLGTEVRDYYNDTRNIFTEMERDEMKAAHSYRYWAFMKWVSDLRKRLLGQPVLPVSLIYDKDGTILTKKAFTDVFYQVHHVWHPNGVGTGWTTATPYFKTSVGQHRRKKEISRTQVGSEFFTFHRDHLELFDRWLARTNQDPIQSLNTCAHDTTTGGSPPAGVDADGSGNPGIDWGASSTNPPIDFDPPHTNYWNGDLSELTNLGLMGQLFATDNNPFSFIAVTGTADSGYHADGHVLNGDLYYPVPNNHAPRFFAWHGYIDDLWKKRRPHFNVFNFALSTNADFPAPQVLTILRDLNTNTDTVEPSNAIAGIDRTTGQGTLNVKLNVRTDPFGRELELRIQCDILKEDASNTPVISITRNRMVTVAQQNADFIEQFVFDGSAGTVDGAGVGPFVQDNPLFSPTATGFKNSMIRITAYLTCNRMADGTIPPVSGTISSSGSTITGAGTSFSSQFNPGDLIRADGQVKEIALINSDTSITLVEAFASNLAAGTSYERLDGFDFEQSIFLPLIQEKEAPEVTTYLNLSSFSKDQVDAVSVGGQSIFDDSFYVILQDRTTRAANIAWPAEVEPTLRNLIAPPVFGAGIYTDAAHAPLVELKELTDTAVPGVSVSITSIAPENPSQHPGLPQRITYTCQVTFANVDAFTGMTAGDTRDLKLVITATDRCGNRVVDDSKRVRLQVNANPYMLDGPTSWLSVDTRVFKIEQGAARFGVAAGWTNPNTFIQDVISNLRLGGGSAGGESFDSLPQDQATSVLEYSTSVNGVNYYNFALSKMRLQSNTGASNVRASFRFFRWGTANVEFDNSLAYRTAASGIALLGKTTTNELASIPFFAEPRVSVSTAMDTQTDPTNVFSFGPTGGVEDTSFFGAYLDINQSTNRFPNTYTGDGGFAGSLYSIRDLLMGNHQCMVVEVVYDADPTVNGATPGTSDNLSQRNLLIVQTANPGNEVTRTIQHLFNIDLTRKRKLVRHKDDDQQDDGETHGGHGHVTHASHKHLNPAENCCENIKVMPPSLPKAIEEHSMHLESGWLAQFPDLLEQQMKKIHEREKAQRQWQFDPVNWKPGTGLDELVFFWNNLPKNSVVEVYIPGVPVTDIFNFRNLRHAPGTVKIVNESTLRLLVEDITYLPIPPFYGDNIGGLITVQLPKGIKKGQRYKVDVLQMRSDQARTLGGFQLNIQVEKAFEIVEQERDWLALFHRRLSVTDKNSRWYPILQKQVEFTRNRGRELVDLANEERPSDPPLVWKDPTEKQKGQRIKVTLEKVQILDNREPFFKGSKGEFRFYAKVHTPDNGGITSKSTFPDKGHFKLGDKPGENEVVINEVIFDDFAESILSIEIGGLELDTFDPDDRLCTYKRLLKGDPGQWIDHYANHNGALATEHLGGWKLWYKVEYSG